MKATLRFVALACHWLLAVATQAAPLATDSTPSHRTIPIERRENGYGGFDSTVIRSKKELESFLAGLQPRGWSDFAGFEAALRQATPDFSKEALVLLRHTEGSGSWEVIFDPPSLQGRKLTLSAHRKPMPPDAVGTADMAYYCFAVAVSKSMVDQVELRASKNSGGADRLAPMVFPIAMKK
jgi:hypothetical protein